jgi:PAS domain S-box-containing protein
MVETQPFGGNALFRHISDAAYFAKDNHGRFIAANAAFVELAGCKSESELLGRTDFDIWPVFMAEHYVKDDARVMELATPVVNRVELVLSRAKAADWIATTKVPVRDSAGGIAGVEGVCRHLKAARLPSDPSARMPAIIDYILENYADKIDIPDLAKRMSLSVKQFERIFKKEYGEPPLRYIQRIRMDAAKQLLASTQLPIERIGRETGFYDNSHFSRQFRKYTGLSPKSFRARNPAQTG